ncbi:hypothetical protein CYLTODRAFT_426998 [Cylindrobasidium torrendii FP15055 ss-10]|uniref:Uncharacterized protein n=1 Tax=Cylindrobasidium torrendii FP15055 ss-10 TaxID=1314674 RepID=A0A0D7AWX4_9AGAR|nr:hypothetical protein CYLTODRAFT_426998 [Cylindrobasidium torrendii FP15055 ss-10]
MHKLALKSQLKGVYGIAQMTFVIACEAVEQRKGLPHNNFGLDEKWVLKNERQSID